MDDLHKQIAERLGRLSGRMDHDHGFPDMCEKCEIHAIIESLAESKSSAPGEPDWDIVAMQELVKSLKAAWGKFIGAATTANHETSAPLSRNTCDYCHQDLGGMAFDGHYTIYCHKPTCEAAALERPDASPDTSAPTNLRSAAIPEPLASQPGTGARNPGIAPSPTQAEQPAELREQPFLELADKWELEVDGKYGLTVMGNSADAYVARCARELREALAASRLTKGGK